MKEKKNINAYILTGVIVVSVIIGGGYFLSASAITVIPLVILYSMIIWKNKKIKLCMDINLAAIVLVTGFYLISPLWALDSGMAFMGSIKFFPILILYLLTFYIDGGIEKIKGLLPVIGTVTTIFAFVMMQISYFENYISVAGRLGGFFQYPNTYALFMLICLIIVSYKIKNDDKKDWLDIAHVIVACIGIYLSGSRTVFILTVAFAIVFFVLNIKNNKKVILGIIGAVVVVGAILIFVLDNEGMSHIISSNLSTFWGRFLYYKDALPYILKHPFGVGYYGYAFSQYEFQTGVYTVVNIHNELLQFMLDIGWVPAILLYVCIIKSIISKDTCERDKMVLSVILIHSLFDYDFQFISMFYILVLFFNKKKVNEYKISGVSKVVVTIIALAAVGFSVPVGISDYYSVMKDYDKSIKAYSGNTMAKVGKLINETNEDEIEKTALDIIDSNEHIQMAYSALARSEFAKGNVDKYILLKEKAISLSPYNYEEYSEYLSVMYYCTMQYSNMGDKNSAYKCYEKMKSIPDKLKIVEEKTSSLGWKIKDKPTVNLSEEELDMIRDAERLVYE